MRVIAGRFRSRRLKSVPGADVRPTPDRLRESLFSVLALRIEGVVFLDAYAGSGTVGIEALSRGARHSVFLETNVAALQVIRENLASLELEREATVVRGRASLLLTRYPADIVFLDPPYQQVSEYGAALGALTDTSARLAIAQHPSRLTLEDSYGYLHKSRVLRQGDNALTFYESETRP